MWPGAEPERGQYNESYFKSVRSIIEDAAEHGVYVLLDMHQDLLSERFCGEGVPKWAALRPSTQHLQFPVPYWLHPAADGPDGLPTRQACHELFANHGWWVGQGAYASSFAYEALYTNVQNLTEAWGAFWAKTASVVKGLTNVLGFELINEPWAGNEFRHPFLMAQGHADRERLQPAYETLARYIRSVDNDTLIVFAGVTWDNTHPVGFEHAPGGADEAYRSVLSYHYYCPPQRRNSFSSYLEQRRQDAKRLGTGLLMSESGVEPLYNEVVPKLNQVGHSWIHWEWKDWCREDNISNSSTSQNAAWGACKTGFGEGPFKPSSIGSPVDLNLERMATLGRPYVSVVAGSLNGTSWDPAAGLFQFRFRSDPRVPGPTELFYGFRSFPEDDFDVIIEPAAFKVELRPSERRVFLHPMQSTEEMGEVLVELRRRQAIAEVLV